MPCKLFSFDMWTASEQMFDNTEDVDARTCHNVNIRWTPITSSQPAGVTKPTLGTCGLNSTARCMASTAFISNALRPRLEATSTENLHQHQSSLSQQAS